jgi:hypothetical protein
MTVSDRQSTPPVSHIVGLHPKDAEAHVFSRMEAHINKSRSISTSISSDIGILILLEMARILLQVFTNGQYGFHQDELVTLDVAGHHLAWGYVAWPPVTPFLARLALSLFGPSVIGLRSFAVLAEGIVMLLAGLMIRDLGGSR